MMRQGSNVRNQRERTTLTTMSRKRIFEIIEKSDGTDHISSIYDISI